MPRDINKAHRQERTANMAQAPALYLPHLRRSMTSHCHGLPRARLRGLRLLFVTLLTEKTEERSPSPPAEVAQSGVETPESFTPPHPTSQPAFRGQPSSLKPLSLSQEVRSWPTSE